jgi:signal transduction histidine kinase/HAMP domain-containing protein
MFSLRMKLLAGLASLLAILIAVTLLGNSVLNRYSNSIHQLFAEDYDSVAASQAMKESLERMLERAQDRAWNANPSASDESRAVPARSNSPDPDIEAFERQLEAQAHIADVPGEREATEKLADAWREFKTAYLSLSDDRRSFAERREIFLQRILPTASEVRTRATAVIDMNLADMEAGRGHARQMAARARWTMHLLAAIGIAVAGGIVLFAGVVVLRPLRVLESSLRQITRGNLELKIHTHTRDEIGQLGRTFNDMAAQLREFKRIDHERLIRTQHTTQLAIDSLPDAVLIIDPRGIVELTNETATRLFGLKPGVNVIDDLSTPWLSDLHQQAMGGDRTPRSGLGYSEAIHVEDGGADRFFLPRTYAIVDEKDNVIGSAIVLADVTELRRLDQMKSDLLATTAHELKTPLTSMRLIMHLMAEERIGPLNPRQRDVISAAQEDSDRLHNVVETLLDMDRIRSGRVLMETRPMRAEKLVRECVEPQRDAIAAAGLELRVDISSDAGEVRVDPQRMGYVFGNLIGNAIKYTPGGGSIRVSAELTANGVHFCVADNGRGIPEQFRHRVFEKFFRAPGQSGESGSGLGLAIVKSVIEAHRGKVWIESGERGQGTRVHFVLPTVAQTNKESGHDASHPQAAVVVG